MRLQSGWVGDRLRCPPMEAATQSQSDTRSARRRASRARCTGPAMAVCRPVAIWGRLRGGGARGSAGASGPVLVVGNHDSHWDPIMVGVSAIRRRQIKALAKSELWKVRGLARSSTAWARSRSSAGPAMPTRSRGRSRSCAGAPASASSPKGPARAGKVLRARSGVGRLALEVPEAKLVCVRDRGHHRLHALPPAPPGRAPLLRAGRRPGSAERAARRAGGPAAGRDPRSSSRRPARAAAGS